MICLRVLDFDCCANDACVGAKRKCMVNRLRLGLWGEIATHAATGVAHGDPGNLLVSFDQQGEQVLCQFCRQ